MSTTELVPSVSIANLVNQRAAVIEKVNAAIELLREASTIAQAAHLGMPRVTMSTGYSRLSSDVELAKAFVHVQRDGSTWEREASHVADVAKILRLGVDSAAWQYLMHESGMRSLMDAEARKTWDEAISKGDVPELTEANVRSTFGMLHASRADIFERGVISCFKGLSWDYKTNLPQKFGKRIVITYLRSAITGRGQGWGGTSLGHPNYDRCNRLDDLERVLTVLDGKPEPDHRQGWYSRMGHSDKTTEPPIESDYLSVRSFRNGNAHITFKRPELVDRMNLILAKHYPGALPAPK